jgi:hypothetical protein
VSRTALIALLALVVVVLLLLRSGTGDPDDGAAIRAASASVPGEVAPEVQFEGDPSVTTQGLLVEELLARIEASDARLLQLTLGAHRSRTAEVRISVSSPHSGAAAIERILVATAAAGLTTPDLRAVVPTPSGVRLDIVGHVLLSSARIAQVAERGTGRSVLDLTELVSQSGARLDRLEMPTGESGTVRLGVHGDQGALVRVVRGVEQLHSSPLRMGDLRIEHAGDDLFDLAMSFDLRPEVAQVVRRSG